VIAGNRRSIESRASDDTARHGMEIVVYNERAACAVELDGRRSAIEGTIADSHRLGIRDVDRPGREGEATYHRLRTAYDHIPCDGSALGRVKDRVRRHGKV
jgi:hypothetical protein